MKPAEVSMPSDREVQVQRSFDAPAQLVWRAYSEPDLMRRWLTAMPGWTMPVCEMDVRVGGKFRWRWRNDEEGQEFGFSGEFREVAPYSRLVHTQDYDAGPSSLSWDNSMGKEPTVITVTFSEANGITSVTTTMRYASKADRDEAFSTGMTDGMEMSYQLLDKVLAG